MLRLLPDILIYWLGLHVSFYFIIKFGATIFFAVTIISNTNYNFKIKNHTKVKKLYINSFSHRMSQQLQNERNNNDNKLTSVFTPWKSHTSTEKHKYNIRFVR